MFLMVLSLAKSHHVGYWLLLAFLYTYLSINFNLFFYYFTTLHSIWQATTPKKFELHLPDNLRQNWPASLASRLVNINDAWQ